jgi:hypothetical protein
VVASLVDSGIRRSCTGIGQVREAVAILHEIVIVAAHLTMIGGITRRPL